MKLTSERLLLRTLNYTDLEFLKDLERNPLNHKYEYGSIPKDDIIIEKYRNFLESDKNNLKRKYYFIVRRIEDNSRIGKITLKMSREEISEWEIGWAFAPNYWGKGYVSEGAKRVLWFAVRDLHVRRIIARCHEENSKSEKVMVRIGMRKEGLLRKVIYINNTWKNQLLYSIFDENILYK